MSECAFQFLTLVLVKNKKYKATENSLKVKQSAMSDRKFNL